VRCAADQGEQISHEDDPALLLRPVGAALSACRVESIDRLAVSEDCRSVGLAHDLDALTDSRHGIAGVPVLEQLAGFHNVLDGVDVVRVTGQGQEYLEERAGLGLAEGLEPVAAGQGEVQARGLVGQAGQRLWIHTGSGELQLDPEVTTGAQLIDGQHLSITDEPAQRKITAFGAGLGEVLGGELAQQTPVEASRAAHEHRCAQLVRSGGRVGLAGSQLHPER
jgi:hypothetical protein